MIPVKIKRIIKEIPGYAYNFGRKVAVAKLECIWMDERLDAVQRKNEIILEYLYRNFNQLIVQYQTSNSMTSSVKNAPIWVMWWEGRMPEVIELCQQSKKLAAGIHPVILLTKENAREYVSFPDIIWERFDAGKILTQHMADMIRVQLIRKYGGIWLDASIYCNGIIPEKYFELPVYSLRGADDTRYVSRNRWTTFVIGGHPNNVLCSFLDDFFQEYCRTGKPFIDYYMFDCAIALAYQHIPAVRDQLKALPIVEQSVYWLNENLYNPAEEVDCSLVPLFSKLSWRSFVNDVPDAGSLYQAFIRG